MIEIFVQTTCADKNEMFEGGCNIHPGNICLGNICPLKTIRDQHLFRYLWLLGDILVLKRRIEKFCFAQDRGFLTPFMVQIVILSYSLSFSCLFWARIHSSFYFLFQNQLNSNLNSTLPKLTLVGFDMNMCLHIIYCGSFPQT